MIKYNLSRYEDKIKELESYPVEKGGLLLYGSSFFTNWGYERAKQDLSGVSKENLPVLNHGFGGSTLDELLYYYSRLVKNYDPKVVLIRGGFNDYGAGYKANEVTFMLSRLCEWLISDFPNVKIGLLPIFDVLMSVSSEEGFMAYKSEYNLFCKHLTEQYDSIFLLDINEFFYQDPKDTGTHKNLKPIFVEDGLHLTDEGYAQFTEYFRNRLKAHI